VALLLFLFCEEIAKRLCRIFSEGQLSARKFDSCTVFIPLPLTMYKSMFVFDPSNGEVVFFDYQMSGENITPSDLEDIAKAINGKK